MREERKETMGRVTALGILARMAYDKERTLDEVNALQMAVRVIANRHFQHERNWKRRRAAKEAMSITPPFVVREEGGTAAALPDGDGAEARQDAAPPNAGEPPAAPEAEVQGTGAGPRAPVEDGGLAEKVRAEVRGLRELAEKLWEGSLMGESFMALRLEAFARRLAQAVGDEPGARVERLKG